MADILIHNESQLNAYIEHLKLKLAKNGALKVSAKSAKKRTLTQNRSIHKYCKLLSEAFNEAGLDMQTVLAEGASIPWSETKVKDDIWKKVQFAALGKKSTTELEKHEVTKVYEIVSLHLSQTFGVFVPFPAKENN